MLVCGHIFLFGCSVLGFVLALLLCTLPALWLSQCLSLLFEIFLSPGPRSLPFRPPWPLGGARPPCSRRRGIRGRPARGWSAGIVRGVVTTAGPPPLPPRGQAPAPSRGWGEETTPLCIPARAGLGCRDPLPGLRAPPPCARARPPSRGPPPPPPLSTPLAAVASASPRSPRPPWRFWFGASGPGRGNKSGGGGGGSSSSRGSCSAPPRPRSEGRRAARLP